jgi:hypothetical protein
MPAADKLGVTPAMGFNLESDFAVFDGNHLRAAMNRLADV